MAKDNIREEAIAEGSIEKILKMSLDEIEKMSDEQWQEYIEPCLRVVPAISIDEARRKNTKASGAKRIKINDLKPRTTSSRNIVDRLRREKKGVVTKADKLDQCKQLMSILDSMED